MSRQVQEHAPWSGLATQRWRVASVVERVARVVCTGTLAMLAACGPRPDAAPTNAPSMAALPWDSVVARARGTSVIWRMWRGDPAINAYVDGWVAPRLKAQFGISLQAVEGQGAEIVNALVTEREAGAGKGAASLLWINGETFAQLRRERLLDGPWSARLPNARYVDSSSAIIARDFEQDPSGYESPWGTVQFALIYDTVRTPNPPRSVNALAAWIHEHPGRFTYDQSFGGVTFLKMLMYARGGGVAHFQGGFDEARYVVGRDSVFAWIRRARPDLWRQGETYPPDVAAMHRLFANGEIDFSMSFNQNEVITKVRRGVLQPTARALLLQDGTIANAHYLGVPFNAPNVAGALVVANFLMSPEAQYEKQRPDVWADGTVLDAAKLPAEWRSKFVALEQDPHALAADSLHKYARPEIAPMYHERLQADWRTMIRRASR